MRGHFALSEYNNNPTYPLQAQNKSHIVYYSWLNTTFGRYSRYVYCNGWAAQIYVTSFIFSVRGTLLDFQNEVGFLDPCSSKFHDPPRGVGWGALLKRFSKYLVKGFTKRDNYVFTKSFY